MTSAISKICYQTGNKPRYESGDSLDRSYPTISPVKPAFSLRTTPHPLTTQPPPLTPTNLPPHVEACRQLRLKILSRRSILLRPGVIRLPLAARRDRHLSRRLLPRNPSTPLTAGDLPYKLSERKHLVENHLPHLPNVIHNLKVKVEGGGALGLVGRVVPDLEVGVLESLLHADARGRVEGEHLVEEVERVRVRGGEEGGEGLLGHVRQVADVLLGAGGADARERLLVGGAEDVQDLVELVDVVAALEEGAAAEELGEDAADGPDVD